MTAAAVSRSPKQRTTSARKKPPAKTTASARKTATAGGSAGTHTLREDNPWAIDYQDHEPRTDSPLYKESRQLLTLIARSTQADGGPAWFYGPEKWEDHHGGGLWVHDGKGWFFLKNFAGIEWASQFCADPARIECLRQNALRLYQGDFRSNTKRAVESLSPGYPFDRVLDTEIRTADDVAQWTDSIFNASVPLPKLAHTGVVPQGHGVHHYPTPVTDIALFKHADFTLWVLDDEKKPTAVVPVHRRGAPATTPHYGEVAVAYATPGTDLHQRLVEAHRKGQTIVGSPKSALAKQAFKRQ